MMQNSLFYDYYALIDSCPFLKKYDALFRAFDLIYDQPDFPELGRRGYRRSAYYNNSGYRDFQSFFQRIIHLYGFYVF